MSIKAMNWAREVCRRISAPPSHRLALLMVCFHHHDQTGECFPSYNTIADTCGYSRRKVIYLIDDLEQNGLLTRQKRRVGGHQGSNRFVLFGRPKGEYWVASSVQKKAPCQSANPDTQFRVQTGAPDRDWVEKGEVALSNLRVVTGGISRA